MRIARLVVAVMLLAAVFVTPAAAQEPGLVVSTDLPGDDLEALPRDAGGLASSELNELVAGVEAGDPSSSVIVEIITNEPSDVIVGLVEEAGGRFLGSVEGELVLAYVPIGSLIDLERAPQIQFLRPPIPVNVTPPIEASTDGPTPRAPVVGDEVAKMNADAWHAAGFTGEGVKIGIIDGFRQSSWQAARAAGEVPAPAGTFCQVNYSHCSIWTADNRHGVAVAEIIHEMAPDAELYLATVGHLGDLQDAVTWFDAQGVQIISRSTGSPYDGPGDGTGPVDGQVDRAVSKGMLWVNSAGNAAGKEGVESGSYWRGTWRDSNGDDFMDFAVDPVVDPLLGFFSCTGTFGVRWDDWGEADRTDFNVGIADTPDDAYAGVWEVLMRNDQQSGANPLELWRVSTCSEPNDVDFLAIYLAERGASSNDTIEFMINGLPIEYWQNPHSASSPVVDSASSGVLAVGAVDPPGGTSIATYSSRGPTNDYRKKPDVVAASCVGSFTYSPSCFQGTSAAAPAVSGAAALVLDAGLASTPEGLRDWLYSNATSDRGVAGVDNAFGHGEIILPDPPGGGGDPLLHVEDLRLILKEAQHKALGRVWVEDDTGNPVQGVTVAAEWTVDGTPMGAATKGTNSSGIAVFTFTDPPAGATLEICVQDLAKTGYGYDPSANVLTCVADTWPGSGPTLDVEDLRVILKEAQNRALGRVWVEDDAGDPVQGVTVTAEWTVDGTPLGAATKGTNSSGIAVFPYDDPAPGATLEICVDDLAKSGYGYDPGSNVVTCAAATWPGGGGGPTVHVDDVRIVLDEPNDQAIGRIWVEDQAGGPVGGVDVIAEWTVDGTGQGGVVKRTASSGIAKFVLASPSPGAALEICVLDLQRVGYTYAPGDNVVTCASATWPGGSGDTMHVASIGLAAKPAQDRVVAKIRIQDEAGADVAGADVDVEWTGDGAASTDTKTTNSKGRATFVYHNPTSGQTVEVCVVDATHPTLTYAPGEDAVTCSSLVYP